MASTAELQESVVLFGLKSAMVHDNT